MQIKQHIRHLKSLEQNVSYTPYGLQLFLRKILVEKSSKKRIASIGHAIVQVARPRVFNIFLQIGRGVQASTFCLKILN